MSTTTATHVAAASGEDRFSGRWWHEPFRVFQTNLRETDADLDVEVVLDDIQRFGANAWLINAGGILSFHPTDLPFQTRNPHLATRPTGDLLGDAIEAAHRRGVRLIARMDLSKVAMRIAKAHPEWCFVGPDGEWQVYGGLVSVCPSAGYYQERSFDILDEVIDRYDVDGFFFNMFGFNEVDYSGHYRGVSQTEASRLAFAEFSGGLTLPTGPDSESYGLWRAWCDTVVADLGRRIREHINHRKPSAALILRRSADILFDEANNELGRELWHHQTSESVSALRSARPDIPVMENCVSFLDMPYRMAGEQPEHFAQYLIQTISRGGNPSTYIMGVPGDIPYPSLELAGEVTRFHARWSEVYAGLVPTATLGLVRPDPLRQSRDQHAQAVREFRGLYSALQERHLPFDVVPLESLGDMAERGGLARYADLVLPDVGVLDPVARAALDAFTARGGRLLLTGRSGFDDAGRAQLAGMPATALRGSVDDADALKSSYVAEPDALVGRRFVGRIVPVYGRWHELALAADAERRFSYLPPAPYGPPEKAYGHRPSDVAGYVRSARGITIVPWTVGYAYHELGLTSIRDHVVDILVEGRGAERVAADLPEHVEVTVLRRGRRLVLHLLNLSGRKRKSFGAPSPTSGGIVRVAAAAPGTTAHTLVVDAACLTRWEDGDLVIALPPIGRFEVLVIDESAEEER